MSHETSHVSCRISRLMSHVCLSRVSVLSHTTHVSCLSHVVYLCTISRLMSHDALYSRVQWYGRQLLSACLMSVSLSSSAHMNQWCTHMNESCPKYGLDMSHIWMSHVPHMDESCLKYEWVMSHIGMGWLRSVGSIKLQVSFAEYRLFYRALLQKRPIILSILLTKATPYEGVVLKD